MRHLFLLLSALLITSCATLTSDIEIETHANPAVDYSIYKTYAWAGSAQIIFDPIGQWEQPTIDTDDEVRFIINRELRARGLKQVEDDSDLLVAFTAGVDTTVLKLKEDPELNQKVLTNIPRAALVIVFIDTNTGYPVWSGYAIGDVQRQQSMDKIRARIHYTVSEMFKLYNN